MLKSCSKIMIYTPIFCGVHVSQSGSLDIFDFARKEPGMQSYQRGIYAAKTLFTGKLSKTHNYKLISAIEPNGMMIAIVSLYAFVELISRNKRHILSEYCLSLIHDDVLGKYNLQRYELKS